MSDARAPDAEWYGAAPEVIRELRGADAEAVIARLDAARGDVPVRDDLQRAAGPNSNTFVAHLARETPEMRLVLPAHAVGK
ncbi:MAG: DUF3750 domain-containing protein [Betaproteobacteria bacterium]|nr:DUF3750 domain-containing protein [Betaproteobacteria bacterium]